MKNNSDKAYQKYKDYDFTDAKTVAETPDLFQLQASNKSRITMRVDEDISVEGLLAGRPSGESQASFKKWLEGRAARMGRRPSPRVSLIG